MPKYIYKCPDCGAIGDELIYDIFIVQQKRVYNNLLTKESHEVLEPLDDNDIRFPIWTRCAACDITLIGEASDYIICQIEDEK